ncbi:sugar phosphate isomerase/epimerase [Paenibacillus sp. sptzw28]|uniref:sugar phosphate isomerase/epimerase family protein n=1 Tax=Paenibacillus sp. sptzw28 TaxID=715179 RepID=UPI001C6DD6E1|nr:sugar phosphate isomerase/epimerase [Paenibacillus sp. sptzw28]QYR19386.1 sugar phosphate isomerase/epimerase [Paenibacillus sp. sptzw28]
MNYYLCSISFRHELVSFSELVSYADERGFAGIELWGVHAKALIRRYSQDVSRLLDSMDSRSIRISMISDYIDISRGNGPTQVLTGKWKSLIALSHSFRTDKIRIFAGNKPSASASPGDWEHCVGRLRELAQISFDYGVYLVIETHPDTFADTLQSTLRLLKDVGHAHVRINLDFLHLWESGTNPLEAYNGLKTWTVNYHLKNIAGREMLGIFAPGNVYSPTGSRMGMTALSDGLIDYSPVIGQLERDQCQHPVAIEWFGDQPHLHLQTELSWLKERKFRSDVHGRKLLEVKESYL